MVKNLNLHSSIQGKSFWCKSRPFLNPLEVTAHKWKIGPNTTWQQRIYIRSGGEYPIGSYSFGCITGINPRVKMAPWTTWWVLPIGTSTVSMVVWMCEGMGFVFLEWNLKWCCMTCWILFYNKKWTVISKQLFWCLNWKPCKGILWYNIHGCLWIWQPKTAPFILKWWTAADNHVFQSRVYVEGWPGQL